MAMHQATIFLNPTGAVPIGFSQAAGVIGDIQFFFKGPNNQPFPEIASLAPQLVLRPFTRPEIHAYDIEIEDPVGASGTVNIPGPVMNDNFNVEVYTRTSSGAPMWMVAYGRISLNGFGYMRSGPLGPASFPTGPSGPAGPAGAPGAEGPPGDPGMRGSRWYTGAGTPVAIGVPDVRVPGDMWLDETNGDVWRWDGAAWTAFKGV